MDYNLAISSLKVDPRMASLIDEIGPCSLSLSQEKGNLFETLISTIIYQQLSGKAAGTILKRFLSLYNDSYPLPQQLLDTNEELIRSVGISRPKIKYLKSLAEHIIAGLPTIEELNTMEDEAVINTLTKIKGIGKWTVQMILIFRLNRLDVFPIDDLGVKNAIKQLYSFELLPTKSEMEDISKSWQPYRTIATWYLWRSLDKAKKASS